MYEVKVKGIEGNSFHTYDANKIEVIIERGDELPRTIFEFDNGVLTVTTIEDREDESENRKVLQRYRLSDLAGYYLNNDERIVMNTDSVNVAFREGPVEPGTIPEKPYRW